MAEQIQTKLIEEEMKESYIDYSMSVIVGRALPDVHDGLKPVHRRILYVMHELGLSSNKPFKKCANVIGTCLAKYHPHGDMAVYDALVRMAQDFSLRYPLINGQGNFGCFTKDTKVALTDGRSLSFEELINEHKEGKKNFTYTIDHNGNVKIAEIKSPRLTRENTDLIKVILDNGEEIRCTSSHKFMLRDGTYKEAQHLIENDSLMPLNNRVSTKEDDPNIAGYLMVYNPKDNKWVYSHHIADEWNLINKVYTRSAGRIKHHVDFNKLNNNPNNIKRLNWKEHWKIHYEIASYKHRTDSDYVKKLAEGRRTYWSNTENKRKLSKRTSVQNIENWKKPSYRKKMIENLSRVNKEYVKNHPELKEIKSKRATETLKRLWENLDYRKRKINHLKERWLNKDPTLNKFTSEISKKIWSNPEHRELVSKKIKEKWKDPLYKKKIISGYIKKWNDDLEFRNYFLNILSQNGIKINYNKFISICKKTIDLYGDLNEENYENVRKSYNSQNGAFVIKFKTGLTRFFNSDIEKLYEKLELNFKKLNHKVIKVEFLQEREDVYDLTIDTTHNFALAVGVFVHNSVDGDSPAAYRYTEARLSKIGEELLADIDKETVRFIPNFDNSTKEPVVLPSKFPNLLVNGSSGIAVGMATNMPPHNLGEVADATTYFIEHPESSVEELMQFIKGPDFPTGGIILGRNGILNAYKTGRGQIKVRANVEIKEKTLIVTEIPYQVNKSLLIEGIADLVRDKVIEGISDIRDESDRKGMRIVFELKASANPEIVLNQLYKHSQLQTTFGIINLALVAGQPQVLNLHSLIKSYVKHRKRIVIRRTQFELHKAEERAHILEGLKIALADIDPVVKTIKQSNSVDDARNALIRNFKLSEKQALAILDMRLQRLTSLETSKIKKEYEELLKVIKEFKEILASEQKIYGMIKQELTELKQKYGDDRRTKIIDVSDEIIEDEDLIKEEEMVITMSHSGYIKRIPLEMYKQQRRGGKGVIASTTKEEDFIEHLFVTSTHAYILFFSDKGRMYWLKAYKIPEASRYAKGGNIVNILALKDEKITAMIPVKEFKENLFLVMATKKGLVKKTSLMEYSRPRQGGIIAITLRENDRLVEVKSTDGSKELLLATAKGMAVRFNEKHIRESGRQAMGVRGIRLQNDAVVGMEIAEGDILSVCENGYGKRTSVEEYRLINRGGKGVINIKTNERNGSVVGVKSVKDNDEVMFITKKGVMIRTPVKNISDVGRNAMGVRLMKLDEGDKVVGVAHIVGEA
ncbi:DNA gyrase subunit A [Candidatus Woesearchaeota archaeon]|nr:DNA gyrase subunit A [Candidatus Woesearchaeota archaeon]